MKYEWRLEGRYEPHKVEGVTLAFWENERIYDLVKQRNSRADKRFNFIDGPPYPSGDVPHLGTAWNKSLKDAVLRYKRMRGYRVYDVPGYDCHGLPIEVKVEQKLGIKVKKEIEQRIGVEKFVEECKRLAINNLTAMTKWFKELGVFMDWDNPYLTLRDEYIEAEWWLVKKADEAGLLDKEERVVYWCPRCSTTLAEYEVEYKELEDPSIYVKFELADSPKEYLVIWTTTPWTLPANTFVMIHPNEYYVKVKVKDEIYIVAEKRLGDFVKDAGIDKYEVVERLPGEALAGKRYRHPLEDILPVQQKLRDFHIVIPAAEFVTMHEGTGLVHGAPGHGFEDYEVAKRSGIPIIACPVDEEGKFTEEAGPYAGVNVREANEMIISDLAKRGYLIKAGRVRHRYPTCWRCKTPIVLRTASQWIIRVSKLKDKLIKEASTVKWVPPWGLSRLYGILENLQDWVISRQRYWGTPLPIWVCPNGHRLVIGSVDELLKYGGFRPRELHKPWIDEVTLKCPVCGLEMRRVPDVMDVWFDSGVCFYAAKGHPRELKLEDVVLDFIVEGHDQIRGWFFSLLRAGVLGFDKAPYRAVLVHGFMLDEQGREMHKSLGNYVGTDEAISKVGRDPLRLWLLSNTTWEDAKFSWGVLDETKRDLSILWNIYAFAKTYMDLDKFDPRAYDLNSLKHVLRVEDKWILSRLNKLLKEVVSALEEYEVHTAVRKIREFYVEDLSHWYIRLIRPRVWVDELTEDKLAAYATLYYVLDRLVRALAPFVPFITEYIYQAMFREYYGAESVHLLEYPMPDEGLVNEELERYGHIAKEVISAASAARMKAGIKIRQPVRALVVYTDKPEVASAVGIFADAIRLVANAKEVSVKPHEELSRIMKYKAEPVYKSIGPKFRSLAREVINYIIENGDSIARDILSKGSHRAVIGGVEVELTKEDVVIAPSYVEGYSVVDTDFGSVAIDTRLSEVEIAEGLARDIVRRIQVMRKELGLPLDARIRTTVIAPEDKARALELMRDYIARETRSVQLIIKPAGEAQEPSGYKKSWEIDGDEYLIGVERVE